MERKNGPSPLQGSLIILACLLSVSLIVFLKMKSDLRSPIYLQTHPEVAAAIKAADSVASVAVPDTTITPDAMPHVPDTVAAAPPDSIGIDIRPASEAGREDGLAAGREDGRHGTLRATFDQTSAFPTEAGRRAYAAAYAEGYAQGYAEGLKHLGEKKREDDTTNGTDNDRDSEDGEENARSQQDDQR